MRLCCSAGQVVNRFPIGARDATLDATPPHKPADLKLTHYRIFVILDFYLVTAQSLFVTVDCPVCGDPEFGVVRASRYPPSITAADLQHLYKASSAHILMDQLVRCRSCAMQYLNPRPNSDLIVGSYQDAVDPTFVAQNSSRIVAFRNTLRRAMVKLGLKTGHGLRLLDVGCAGGAFPVAARDLGFDPIGIEPSRWLADFGRRTYGLDIREGILEAGIFAEASFDVITLWDVIEHVPQPHALLSVIATLLKPQGLLFVNYPDVASLAARLLRGRWPFWLNVHLLYYNRATMHRQLTRAGFSPLWFEPFWPRLPFGYVLERAAPYFPPASLAARLVTKTSIGSLPVVYNMGQTLVVCRSGQGHALPAGQESKPSSLSPTPPKQAIQIPTTPKSPAPAPDLRSFE